MVASMLNFNTGEKKVFKLREVRKTRKQKGKNQANAQTSNAAHNNNPNKYNKANKTKEKGYKGKSRLIKVQMEQYQKDNKCFKCGELGHVSSVCPKCQEKKGNPRVTLVKALEEDCHHSGCSLSDAWGKVREHNTLIFFDPSSTHNFISTNLATKLRINEFGMGKVIKANGTFQGK